MSFMKFKCVRCDKTLCALNNDFLYKEFTNYDNQIIDYENIALNERGFFKKNHASPFKGQDCFLDNSTSIRNMKFYHCPKQFEFHNTSDRIHCYFKCSCCSVFMILFFFETVQERKGNRLYFTMGCSCDKESYVSCNVKVNNIRQQKPYNQSSINQRNIIKVYEGDEP